MKSFFFSIEIPVEETSLSHKSSHSTKSNSRSLSTKNSGNIAGGGGKKSEKKSSLKDDYNYEDDFIRYVC